MSALPEMGYSTPPVRSRDSWWSPIQQLIMNPRPVSLAYAFSIGLLVSFMAWSVVMPPDGAVDSALVGTMARSGSPIVYERPISGDLDVGQIYATVRNAKIQVEIRWTDDSPASLRIAYNPDELFATGVESVMGESSLATVTRTDSHILYDVAGASIDITSLVAVRGAASDLVSVIDVWISADGMTPVQHRISVTDVN
jgi:hypothetical protein